MNSHIRRSGLWFRDIFTLRLFSLLTLLFVSSFFAGRPAFAQVTNATGTIQGTITDQIGAVIPTAKITLTQPSTGLNKTILTTGAGYYSVGSLIPGDYTVRVEAPGFAVTSETLVVKVGVVTNGDLKLGVGSATTQVQVQASAVQD